MHPRNDDKSRNCWAGFDHGTSPEPNKSSWELYAKAPHPHSPQEGGARTSTQPALFIESSRSCFSLISCTIAWAVS